MPLEATNCMARALLSSGVLLLCLARAALRALADLSKGGTVAQYALRASVLVAMYIVYHENILGGIVELGISIKLGRVNRRGWGRAICTLN